MSIIERTTGGNDEENRQQSDSIFVCVLIGFMEDSLMNGRSLRWDVEPNVEKEENLENLKTTLSPLLEAIKRSPVKRIKKIENYILTTGYSPAQSLNEGAPHLAIAGVPIGHESIDCSSEIQPVSDGLMDFFYNLATGEDYEENKDNNAELKEKNLDRERGAYYGVVDHKDNNPPKMISSVRRLIGFESEGGRWNSGKRFHGLINQNVDSSKQAGSVEPTGLISSWNDEEHVCGYCHGMTNAIAQAECVYEGGVPFEVALGKHTTKLASCFGCATFMVANNYVASSIHLGRGESWVPLPVDEEGLGAIGIDPDKIDHCKTLNLNWAKKVSDWLYIGSCTVLGNDAGVFEHWVSINAQKIGGGIQEELSEAKKINDSLTKPLSELNMADDFYFRWANIFLDALTIHDKDINRVTRTLIS